MESDRNTLNPALPLATGSFNLRAWPSAAAKRLMDALLAALGLFVLAPFFALVGLMIKRDSPGPVFYRGPRLGRGGRPFGILKFRTMREEPASYAGPGLTAADDPRITPLGRWLRDTKINELPQLWNVLAGEMSLVGPRPEDPEIAAAWPEAVRREILSVRPGITSPTSIAYHDEEKRLKGAGLMDEYFGQILPDKMRLDQLYVRHHSFLTDLDALFWTFVILLPRLKERSIPEGWLFGGPLTRFLRRYVSWAMVDFVVAFVSVGLAGVLWRFGGPLDLGVGRAIKIALLLAFLFGMFNSLLGLKPVEWSRAAAEDVFRLIVSCGLVTLAVIALQVAFLPQPLLPVRFMLLAGLLVLLGFVAVRYRLRLVSGLASRWITLRRSGYGAGERALIVGAGEGGEFAAWLLNRPDFRRMYTAVGLADDDPAKQGMRFDGLKVLGTTADIPELIERHDISLIFHAIASISEADSRRILSICTRTGLRVLMLSEIIETLNGYFTKGACNGERAAPEPAGLEALADAGTPLTR